MYFSAGGVDELLIKLIITHDSSLNCSNCGAWDDAKRSPSHVQQPKIFSKCTDYRDHCSFLPSFSAGDGHDGTERMAIVESGGLQERNLALYEVGQRTNCTPTPGL